MFEAPVAQWFKRWPTDLADWVRIPLEAKSSQPKTDNPSKEHIELHYSWWPGLCGHRKKYPSL